MTAQVNSATPNLIGAPGDAVGAQLTVRNTSSTDAIFTIRTVGLAGAHNPDLRIPLAAGSTETIDVRVNIPVGLGVGQHAAAFEVASDQPGEPAALSPFSVSIDSVDRLIITTHPSVIRARRRARFDVEITNIGAQVGDGVDVVVDIRTDTAKVRQDHRPFRLPSGTSMQRRVRLTGPRRWFGEPEHHNITIVAHGRSTSTSIDAPFIQRPVFGYKWKSVIAAVAVIALFVGAFWAVQRAVELRRNADDAGPRDLIGAGVDVDGDGFFDPRLDENGDPIPGTGGGSADRGSGADLDGDGFFDPATDEAGNPIPGTGGLLFDGGDAVRLARGAGTDLDGDGFFDPLVGVDGEPIPGTGGAPIDGTEKGTPTNTSVGGTVSAVGTRNISDIQILTRPIKLGDDVSPNAIRTGFRSGGVELPNPPPSPTTKIWPARAGADLVAQNPVRQTEPLRIRTASPEDDGIWYFNGILVGLSHEVVFFKPGYDKQSFVLTPPPDGAPVELDVELIPSIGQLGGAVTDRNGRALQGVEISVTDGVLVFDTTTASVENDDAQGVKTGEWKLNAISTPGIYTVSASLEGYGTEVRQIELADGASNLDVDFQLTSGVGSISGRVFGTAAEGLGGVKVTASNGKVTRSTTTRTARGLEGTFDIPQLDFSGNYTLTASRKDLITQSRSVPVPGPQQIFRLIRKTNALSGTVTQRDPTTGALVGILNAGVTVTDGDLTTRAVTDARGTFEVDQLPPGNYVVTIEAHKFNSTSRRRTIVAGTRPADVDVTLTPNNGEPDIGTGALTVVVTNADKAAAVFEVKNAKLQLTSTEPGSTAEFYPVPDDDPDTPDTFDDSITIPNLRLGTYRVVVSAVGFNTSPEILVSIGRSIGGVGRVLPVELSASGEAKGTIVDVFGTDVNGEKVVLNDARWRVTLTVIQGNERTVLPDSPAAKQQADGSLSWETEDDTLATGDYTATVLDENVQLGYVVYDEQPFTVSDVSIGNEPVPVPPIRAIPFPSITGRIFVPRLVGTTTTFVPLDDDSLAVSITCAGTTFDVTGPSRLLDQAPDGGPGNDTFFISKEDVDNERLLVVADTPTESKPADCTITASADDRSPGAAAGARLTTTVDLDALRLPAPLDPQRTDRVINIALGNPPGDFGGTVFWVDERPGFQREVLLGGVQIQAVAETEFVPSDSTGTPQDEARPDIQTSTIPTNNRPSAPDGTWSFPDPPIPNPADPRQIFNTATYDFKATGFGDATLQVKIDENGRDITGSTAMNLDERLGDAKLRVELTPPDKRNISGDITILTNNPPQYAAVLDTMSITGPVVPPSGATSWPVVRPTPDDGTFTVPNAPPGTWTVGFTRPFNHEFRTDTTTVTDTTDEETHRLEPGTDNDLFDTTLVELGLLDVVLVEVDGNDNKLGNITGPAKVSLASLTTGYVAPTPLDVPTGNVPAPGAAPPPSNVYRQARIAVDRDDPTGKDVNYRITVEVPGFDTSTATVTAVAVTAAGTTRTPVATTRDTKSIIVPSRSFRAGTKHVLEIRLPRYGSITGKVIGLDGGSNPGLTDPPPPEARVVVATRVFDIRGLTPNPATEPSIGVEGPATDGTFTVSGPPGYYQFTVSHPNYDTPQLPLPTTVRTKPGVPLPLLNPPNLADGLFLIENDAVNTLTGDFRLPILKGELDVTAVDDLDAVAGKAIPTAWYVLRDKTTQNLLREGPIGVSGNKIVDELFPGVYTLEVRSYAMPLTRTDENAFPAIVDITIGESTRLVTSVRRVRASLPPLARDIVGDIVFVNQNRPNPGPVALPPALLPITIADTYAKDKIEVDGVPIDQNELALNDQNQLVSRDVSVDIVRVTDSQYQYRIPTVGTGNHVITLPDIDGFITPTPNTIAVPVTDLLNNTIATTATYVAKSTTVTFELTAKTPAHSHPGFEATLTGPAPGNALYGPVTRDPDTGLITFPVVNPEIGDFTLTVDDELHRERDIPVQIPADTSTSGVTPLAPVDLVGNVARINGIVRQNPGNLPFTGTLTLTRVNPDGTSSTSTINHTGGDYMDIDLAAEPPDPPGYSLLAENTGYTSSTVEVKPLIAGTVSTLDPIIINQFATARVEITNATLVPNGAASLVEIGGNGVRIPAVAATTAGTAITYRFEVEPGSYFVEFAGDGYDALQVSTTPINLGAGEDPPIADIVLPRQVRVFVPTNISLATVRIKSGSPPITQRHSPATPYLFLSTPSANEFPISGLIATGNLPAGELAVTVRANGAVQNDPVIVPAGTLGASITVPLQTVPIVTVNGRLTEVDGAPITFIPSGTTIKATAPAVTDPEEGTGDEPVELPGTLEINDAGEGVWQVPGLSTTAYGNFRQWTIVIDQPGFGSSNSTQFIIRDTSTSSNVSGKTVKVTRRPVAVRFTVTSLAGDSVAGSLATIGGVAKPPALAGNASVITTSIRENASPAERVWTISGATNHADAGGTLDAITTAAQLTAGLDVPVALTSTKITGTVTNAAGDPVTGATVHLCADATGPGDCTTPLESSGVLTGSTFEFDERPPGDYRIYASKTTAAGGSAGVATFTVALNGVPGDASVVVRSVTITGEVKLGTDTIAGATVSLCPIGSPAGPCTTTNTDGPTAADGKFSFTGQGPGTYPIFATRSTTTGAGTTADPLVTVVESGSGTAVVEFDVNDVLTTSLVTIVVSVQP